MDIKQKVMLCYQSDDENMIAIAQRYWELDTEGNYAYKTTDIADMAGQPGLSKGGMIVGYLRDNIATAYSAPCEGCGGRHEVRSRNDAQGKYKSKCAYCASIKYQAEKEEERARLEPLFQRIAQEQMMKESMRVDYEHLPYKDLFMLMALIKAAGAIIYTDQGFRYDLILDMMPMPRLSQYKWMDLLHTKHCIHTFKRDLNDKTVTDGFLLEDGNLMFSWEEACFRLVPHVDGGLHIIEQIFQARQPGNEDQESLVMIWLENSVWGALAYLEEQGRMHNLWSYLEENLAEEIKAVLYEAFCTLSLSNVWGILWKVVRDTAALSMRDYYNVGKAVNTIPGKIKRDHDMIMKGLKNKPEWKRPSNLPQSTVDALFEDIYGIDERTSGEMAAEIIGKACAKAQEPNIASDSGKKLYFFTEQQSRELESLGYFVSHGFSEKHYELADVLVNCLVEEQDMKQIFCVTFNDAKARFENFEDFIAFSRLIARQESLLEERAGWQ